jgi:photosystem II stability/assembly factor-like uncharacterized protein
MMQASRHLGRRLSGVAFASAVIALTATTAGLFVPALGVRPAHAGEADGDAGPAAPAEHEFLQKTVDGQPLPRHAYDIAAAQAAQLDSTGGAWQPLGPTNIGGRVTSLALDPVHADTLYAAAASGGVWVSRDAGSTFSPAWPGDLTQAIGAVATAPDGTVYAGTGEVNPGGGSLTYTGTGLYRSRDGGQTWQNLGLADSGAIGAVTVDPANPQRIFVAAAGSLFNPGGDRGVYRSLDGGATWTRVLAGATDFTGATEVFLDPANAQRLYAILWDHRREPDKRSYGGVGSGIFRSTDGGTTWQRLGNGLPGASEDVGRIGLGIATSDPRRMYAIVNQTSGFFQGFYGSTDAGDNWTRLPDNENLATNQSSYGWWFSKLWVDPTNANHVHAAGIALLTTRNGGRSWTTQEDAIHADQHAMGWDPRHPGRVYLGNDGGLYRSDADGDGKWVKSSYEPWTQFYSGAITAQDTSRVSGGAQDNGSLRSWGKQGAFNEYFGGDGEENLISPADDNVVYACYQYGNCALSTNGGDHMTPLGATTKSRANWFTPVQFDPTDPQVMYYGGNRLNRSTDGGRTWTAISPDLTGGPSRDTYPFGTITTVAAANDGHTVYVGTDDGRVWVTPNLGATWTLLLSGQPWVTRIAVSPSNPATAWVSLSGYRSGSPLPHVLRTTDTGASWLDLTGNLPQAPVNDVIVGAGATIYVATDQAVFVSAAGDGQWLRLGAGLPLVPVDDIEYDAAHNRLVAATFGRGFYQIAV